jgi:hypothetical protein
MTCLILFLLCYTVLCISWISYLLFLVLLYPFVCSQMSHLREKDETAKIVYYFSLDCFWTKLAIVGGFIQWCTLFIGLTNTAYNFENQQAFTYFEEIFIRHVMSLSSFGSSLPILLPVEAAPLYAITLDSSGRAIHYFDNWYFIGDTVEEVGCVSLELWRSSFNDSVSTV